MKINEIKTIVELMSEHDLTEFKIEAEEMHLCIRRGSSNSVPLSLTSAPIISAQSAPMVAPVAAGVTQAKDEEADTGDGLEGKEVITSPIVGTFYRAPAPDADPFVNVGDKVTEESVVCIVEAMKVMNEIKAEKSGVIREILMENAQPVEFGQPLFVIE